MLRVIRAGGEIDWFFRDGTVGRKPEWKSLIPAMVNNLSFGQARHQQLTVLGDNQLSLEDIEHLGEAIDTSPEPNIVVTMAIAALVGSGMALSHIVDTATRRIALTGSPVPASCQTPDNPSQTHLRLACNLVTNPDIASGIYIVRRRLVQPLALPAIEQQ